MPALYDRVKTAFAEVDPMGLLKMDAPEDEYDTEIRDVVERLERGQVPGVQLVFEVFNAWFFTYHDADTGVVCQRQERRKVDRKPGPAEVELGSRLEKIVEEWNAEQQGSDSRAP